ncbi:MAG: glycoside hydrolase [Gemmatimonadota bacterium]|nr:glycoside hydrolase [Gemmatimonadota bacterium]MDH3423311.1 glycoside hydrolase [Gemmatimonadota bacterium]
MKRISCLSLLVVGSLAGCGEAPSQPLSLSAREIASPAGADSGEPFLSVAGDTVLMSWIGRSSSGARQVRFARYAAAAWGEPIVVAEPDRLLVNVADFPSILQGPDGTLWAHWPERDAQGFGYGVRISRSTDGGATWSDPWIPHTDGTPTEHGFVSTIAMGDEVGILWLDGRAFARAADGSDPTMETALYFRTADGAGSRGPEVPVDVRVCDCCQTDVATTSRGPVLAYRDRSPEEIRDIRVTRYEGGAWGRSRLVHEDGWETGACPINGPAVAATEEHVAVAWFTAADGESRVMVAFSDDAAESFGDATRIDDGAPAGRVDVIVLEDGSALVSWLERTGGDGSDVRIRRVGPGGQLLESLSVSAPSSERAAGFPRLARAGDGAIILAWTDGADLTPRVRVTRIELEWL